MRHMKGHEMKRILTRDDYVDPRPTRAARFFLGKVLCVRAPDGYAEGMITETEAYGGIEDAASHAFGNRRTARTEIMFAPGGAAYFTSATACTGCSTSSPARAIRRRRCWCAR